MARIENLVEALDDIPVTDTEAREVVARLGIDVPAWADEVHTRIRSTAVALAPETGVAVFPSIEEVRAHAMAHPSQIAEQGEVNHLFGVWLCLAPAEIPILVRLRAGEEGRIWTDTGEELTVRLYPGTQWIPCKSNGATLRGGAGREDHGAPAVAVHDPERDRITPVPEGFPWNHP
jgi:hypothetical protein